MTGRLEIVEGMRQIEVFFEEGTPIHATKEDALLVEGASVHKGYDVVLESLMWKKGKFAFHSKIQLRSAQSPSEWMHFWWKLPLFEI